MAEIEIFTWISEGIGVRLVGGGGGLVSMKYL
jgi:hypothetical protein